jgi:hypothetical protein
VASVACVCGSSDADSGGILLSPPQAPSDIAVEATRKDFDSTFRMVGLDLLMFMKRERGGVSARDFRPRY